MVVMVVACSVSFCLLDSSVFSNAWISSPDIVHQSSPVPNINSSYLYHGSVER
jgi:hypothetical protein